MAGCQNFLSLKPYPTAPEGTTITSQLEELLLPPRIVKKNSCMNCGASLEGELVGDMTFFGPEVRACKNCTDRWKGTDLFKIERSGV